MQRYQLLLLFIIAVHLSTAQLNDSRWYLYPDRGPTIGETQVLIYAVDFESIQAPNSTYPDPYCFFGKTAEAADWIMCPIQAIDKFCLSCTSKPVSNPQEVIFGYSLTGSSADLIETNINFVYYTNPILKSISPVYGPLSGGTTVLVKGSGFLDYGSYLRCGIGTVLVEAIYLNSTDIECITPPSTVANTPIPVRVTQNLLQFTEDQGFFVYRSNPIFISNDPIRGPIQGGTNITITGLNLDPVNGLAQILGTVNIEINPYVQFGAGYVSAFHILSSTEGWVIAPQVYSAQTVLLSVSYSGKDYIETGLSYTYYESATVIELVPSYAYVDETKLIVKVLGLNYIYSKKIEAKYGSSGALVSCTYISESEIDCPVPPNPQEGVYNFYLQTETDPMFNTYLTFTFYSIPYINGFSPKSGPISGDTRLTVTGGGFLIPNNNNTYCVFQNQFKMPATIINSTALYCSTPVYQGIIAVGLSGIIDTRSVSSKLLFNYYEVTTPAKYIADLSLRVLSYKLPSASVQFPYSKSLSGYVYWVAINSALDLTFIMPYKYENNPNITGFNVVQGYSNVQSFGMAGNNLNIVVNPFKTSTLVPIFITLNDQQYNSTDSYIMSYESPTIQNYYPQSAPISGSTIIYVYGKNFNLGNIDIPVSYLCRFISSANDEYLSYAYSISDNCIQCQSPLLTDQDTLTLSVAIYGDEMMPVGPIDYYGSPIISSTEPNIMSQLSISDNVIIKGQNFKGSLCSGCIPLCVFISKQDPSIVIYSSATVVDENTVQCDIPNVPLPGEYNIGYALNNQPDIYRAPDSSIVFYNSFITKVEPNLLSTSAQIEVSVFGYGFANTGAITGVFVTAEDEKLKCFGQNCEFSITFYNETYLSFLAPKQSDVTYQNGTNIGENYFFLEISLYGDGYTKNSLALRYFDIKTTFSLLDNKKQLTLFSTLPQSIITQSEINIPTDMATSVVTSAINPQCILIINGNNIYRENAIITMQKIINGGSTLSLEYTCFYENELSTGSGFLNMTLGGSQTNQVAFVNVIQSPTLTSISPTCGFYQGNTKINEKLTGDTTLIDTIRMNGVDTKSTNGNVFTTPEAFTYDNSIAEAYATIAVNLSQNNFNSSYLLTNSRSEFLYFKKPSIITLKPQTVLESNTLLTVYGVDLISNADFNCKPQCKIGDKLSSTTYISNNAIKCLVDTIPSSIGNSSQDTLELSITWNGIDWITSNTPVQFYSSFKITRVAPITLQSYRNDTVYIYGEGFLNLDSPGSVTYICRIIDEATPTGYMYTHLMYFNSSVIACPVPSYYAPGSVLDISFSYDGETFYNIIPENGDKITTFEIDYLAPNTGPSYGGTTVYVVGAGFEEGWPYSMIIDDYQTVKVTYINSTTLSLVIPASRYGNTFIGVVNLKFSPDGKNYYTLLSGYTYFEEIPATSLYPNILPTTGGQVVIEGSFDYSNIPVRCKLLGAIAETSVKPNIITCYFGEISIIGISTLTDYLYISLNNGIYLRAGQNFMISVYGIDFISPKLGPTTGGTIISIIGQGFPASLSGQCRIGAGNVEAYVEAYPVDYNTVICEVDPYPINVTHVMLDFDFIIYDSDSNKTAGVWFNGGLTYSYYQQPFIDAISPTLMAFSSLSNLTVTSSPTLSFGSALELASTPWIYDIVPPNITCLYGTTDKIIAITKGYYVSAQVVLCEGPQRADLEKVEESLTTTISVALNGFDYSNGVAINLYGYNGGFSGAKTGRSTPVILMIIILIIGIVIGVVIWYLRRSRSSDEEEFEPHDNEGIQLHLSAKFYFISIQIINIHFKINQHLPSISRNNTLQIIQNTKLKQCSITLDILK